MKYALKRESIKLSLCCAPLQFFPARTICKSVISSYVISKRELKYKWDSETIVSWYNMRKYSYSKFNSSYYWIYDIYIWNLVNWNSVFIHFSFLWLGYKFNFENWNKIFFKYLIDDLTYRTCLVNIVIINIIVCNIIISICHHISLSVPITSDIGPCSSLCSILLYSMCWLTDC